MFEPRPLDDQCQRRDRGSALVTVLLFIMILAGAALAVAMTSNTSATRASSERDMDEAAAVGEAAMAYITELWRAYPDSSTTVASYPSAYPNGFLYVTTKGADDWAHIRVNGTSYMGTLYSSTNVSGAPPSITCTEAACLGKWFTVGKGRFCVIGVKDTTIAGKGKMIRVVSQYNNVNYTWEAVLNPNALTPIQGVGTRSTQSWTNGSTFNSLAGGSSPGTVFGNGNLTFSSPATITGNAFSAGSITGSSRVSGTTNPNTASTTFPDAQTYVDAKYPVVQANQNTAGFWTDPRAALAAATTAPGAVAPTGMQVFAADATHLNTHQSQSGEVNITGWSSTNTMNMTHVMIKGGKLTLPAGNYAFGRLWLDGATLIITVPPGGSQFVMPDVYLTNGARLIIDASSGGQVTTVSGTNNSFANGSTSMTGSTAMPVTNGATWNGSGWTSGIASPMTMTGDSKKWTQAGGASGQAKPLSAMSGGDVAYYDDWLVKDNSVLATVTASPSQQGMQVYNNQSVDLTVVNGARVMAGVQPGDLAALTNPSTSMATLDAMNVNASGFVYWSAGGGNPRFDVWDGGGTGAKFTGLMYGSSDASFGANSTYTGAYVGNNVRNMGLNFWFDPTLSTFVQQPAPNTQHVMTKRRIQNPPASFFTSSVLGAMKY